MRCKSLFIFKPNVILFCVVFAFLQRRNIAGFVCHGTHDLNFCSMVNYNVTIEYHNGNSVKTPLQLDATAQLSYEAFERKLFMFDCSKSYGAFDCAACKEAYKSWICAVHFTRCLGTSTCSLVDPSVCFGSRGKICLHKCNDVALKCPEYFKFKCPSELDIKVEGSVYTLDAPACIDWEKNSQFEKYD